MCKLDIDITRQHIRLINSVIGYYQQLVYSNPRRDRAKVSKMTFGEIQKAVSKAQIEMREAISDKISEFKENVTDQGEIAVTCDLLT